MKKIGLGILIAVVISILTAGLAFALPANKGIEKAKEMSPAITDKGVKAPPEFVIDLPESQLAKVVFIRYAPEFSKEKPCNNNDVCDLNEGGWCADCRGGDKEEPDTACYDFLAGSKPHWNWTEDYYYSTSELGAVSVWATGIWDEITSATIFGIPLAGTYNWGIYDYKNAISYGDYPEEGVIAVTAVWFRGKNIYEYDIMFDTDYFPGTIDLDTVGLHEFGHAAGLGDLYDAACVSEVMYGIYDGVDLDLGAGDTAGIQKLYGL
jgi:hypothetical protein